MRCSVRSLDWFAEINNAKQAVRLFVLWLTSLLDDLPWHSSPSPENPSLHEQVCDPTLFLQVANLWHGLVKHSLMSAQYGSNEEKDRFVQAELWQFSLLNSMPLTAHRIFFTENFFILNPEKRKRRNDRNYNFHILQMYITHTLSLALNPFPSLSLSLLSLFVASLSLSLSLSLSFIHKHNPYSPTHSTSSSLLLLLLAHIQNPLTLASSPLHVQAGKSHARGIIGTKWRYFCLYNS